ncbi:MAG: Ig-like domain-containing protein, partial [Reichenbachiella sp.]
MNFKIFIGTTMNAMLRNYQSLIKGVGLAFVLMFIHLGLYAQQTFSSAITTSNTTIDLVFGQDITAADHTMISINAGAVNITGSSFTLSTLTLTVDPLSSDFSSSDLDFTAGSVSSASGGILATNDEDISDGIEATISSESGTNVGSIQIDLSMNLDESGDVKYVVSANATTPTNGDVLAGDDNIGTAFYDGSLTAVTLGTPTSVSLVTSTLTDATIYYVHFYVVDANGNESTVSTTSFTADVGAPTILSTDLALDNTYLDIEFSEGVYGIGGAALNSAIENEFTLTYNDNSSGATLSVSSITQTGGGALVGGESTIRFNLTIGGSVVDGGEDLEIAIVDASSVEDLNGNLMTAESTGTLNLIVDDSKIVKSANHTSISSIVNGATGSIVFQFTIENPHDGNGDRSIKFDEIVFNAGTNNEPADWTDIIAGARLELTANPTVDFTTSVVIGTSSLSFDGIDDGNNNWGDIDELATKEYQLKVWLNTTITNNETIDNDILQFSLGKDDINFTSGRNLDGTTSFDSSDDVIIDVVGTKLNASSFDGDAILERAFNETGYTIEAVDANGNRDTDDVSVLSVTGPSGISVSNNTMSAGVATPTITIVDEQTSVTLIFTDTDAIVLDNSDVDDEFVITIEDTNAPTSSTIVPFNTETGIEVLDDLSIQFSEEVAGAAGKSITLYSVSPTFHSISINADDTDYINSDNTGLVTIVLPESLKASRTYTVSIPDGAFNDFPNNTDAVGDAELDYDSDYTTTNWQFTTTVDNVNPSIEITKESTSTGDGDSGTSDNSVTFNLDWSEEIDDSTFDLDDIAIDFSNVTIGGVTDANTGILANDISISANITLNNSGDDQSYTLTINNIVHTGGVTNGLVNITVGTAVNDLGQPLAMSSTESASVAFNIDQNDPEIESLTILSDNGVNTKLATTSDEISLDFVFTEDLNISPTVILKSGADALVNGTITVSDKSDADERTWLVTFDVNALDSDGKLKYVLDLEDVAGNQVDDFTNTLEYVGGGPQASSTELYIDRTVPSVESLSIVSDNGASTSESTSGDIVTITVDFDDDLSADPVATILSGGSALNGVVGYTETNAANDIWEISYTSNALDNEGAITFDITYTDDAGNVGVSVDETN